MSKTPKKSVSFTDSTVKPEVKADTYKIDFSVKSFPVHLLWISYTLFQQDLEKKNGVEEALIKSIYQSAVIQVVYSVILLSQLSNERTGKRVKCSLASDYHHFLFGALGCLAGSVVLFIAVVLFGAPFDTVKENCLLALQLAVLLYPAMVLYVKVGANKASYRVGLGVAAGAWLGAIAIPLDWDRPWQAWPLPIVGGGYLGAFMGCVVSGLL